MSKYVILGIPKKDDKYIKNVGLFFHTSTKYPNNKPYFSSMVTEYQISRYAIEKEKVPEVLKLAQHTSYGYERIIVLKVNSPKLRQYLK